MTTHLVHAPLDLTAFNQWAKTRGLVRRRTFDAGFALHVLLTAMFGPRALQPFRVFAPQRRRLGSLYAYSQSDADALRRTADTVAPPECLTALNPAKLRSKAMPRAFEPGQQLGFDIRVRPVKRLRRSIHDSQSGEVVSQGAECDAFRVAAMQRFPHGWNTRPGGTPHEPHSLRGQRGEVYFQWLAERLGDAATVEPGNCHLASFARSRIVRGAGRGPEGPDATLHGTLTVAAPDGFHRLVRHGIGRHKAYGYGMLLLRPPRMPKLER